MRSNVAPTWEQVAPPRALTIRLSRVVDFWRELQSSDLKSFEYVFMTAAEAADAAEKIKTYYNEAIKCLEQYPLDERLMVTLFQQRMQGVSVCLSKTSVPSFIVLEAIEVTPAFSPYTPQNHLDAEDYVAETPAPTPKATPEPTLAPPTLSPSPSPPVMKRIYMRPTIIPTWDQVAPRGGVTIKLNRILDFWGDLSLLDVSTYESIYPTATEKSTASKKIVSYYGNAAKCFSSNVQMNERTTQALFAVKSEALKKCMAATAIPSFAVPGSVFVTPAEPRYNPDESLDQLDYYPL